MTHRPTRAVERTKTALSCGFAAHRPRRWASNGPFVATELKPYHVGEVVVRALLEQLRECLTEVVPIDGAGSLGQDIATLRGNGQVEFVADAAPVKVHERAGQIWALDGMHRVDVLAKVGDQGVAIEVKLGLDRLRAADVRRRFQGDCGRSKHTRPRLTGSMIAVLEHRFAFEHDRVSCCVAPEVELSREWWLVVREQVWAGWSGRIAPELRNCRVITLESLVRLAGGEEPFNKLVASLVGGDFYRAWGLG